MKNLIIAGGGGFGAEVAWVAEEMRKPKARAKAWNILGYVDDDPAKTGQELFGYRILGSPEDVASRVADKEVWFCCAIGNNAARQRMAGRLNALGWRAATLIHPSVIRARNVVVGDGTYIGPLSVLNPSVLVGQHVLINQRVAIGHDSIVNDFASIFSGVQVNGGCQIGRSCTVGSNASIYPGHSVGEGATVGANSLVIQNVAAGISVLGIPARKIA